MFLFDQAAKDLPGCEIERLRKVFEANEHRLPALDKAPDTSRLRDAIACVLQMREEGRLKKEDMPA